MTPISGGFPHAQSSPRVAAFAPGSRARGISHERGCVGYPHFVNGLSEPKPTRLARPKYRSGQLHSSLSRSAAAYLSKSRAAASAARSSTARTFSAAHSASIPISPSVVVDGSLLFFGLNRLP